MICSTRKIILRGIVFGAGPVAQVVAAAPYAAIGPRAHAAV
jgi:hypothetical protein